MKKRISVLILVALFLFSACGKTANTEEPLPEEELSSSEVEAVEIPEEEEEPEEKTAFIEPAPTPFFIDDEINGEEIIYKAWDLGLLQYAFEESDPSIRKSWDSMDDLNIDLVNYHVQGSLAALNEDYILEFRDYESPNNVEEEYMYTKVYQIPQKEYEGYVQTYVDIPVEKLRTSQRYNEDTETYECHNSAGEGGSVSMPSFIVTQTLEYEAEEVRDNIYEISIFISSTLEYIITVENNDNIPKYLGVAAVEEETPAPIAPPPVNNPEPPATPSTSDPTPPATSGTGDSSGSGSTGGSWKDDLPGDPDVATDSLDPPVPGVDWSHLD